MILRYLMPCIMSLFLSFGLYAQQDAKAKKLLEEVSAKVKSYDNMKINFNYIYESDTDNLRQETKGCVALEGDKYKLDLLGTTRIFDGVRLYDIIPEDEEVNIAKYDPKGDNELSPSRMLSFYEEGYTYDWDIEQNVEGRKVQYIKLKPKDQDAEIKEVFLGIDAQTKHINKMIQVFKDKSKLIIEVKSFKVNQPLSKNLFKFDESKYSGYYINRLD